MELLLLTKTFALLEPTTSALDAGIAASLARRFADDPAATLQSLSKEDPGDSLN